jgi:hypothetical protein
MLPHLPHIQGAGLDIRVLLFTLAVVVLTGLVFGAWPAMQAARVDPVDALKDGERSVTSAWVVRRRGALLITEVALSAVLLVGAILMMFDGLTAWIRLQFSERSRQRRPSARLRHEAGSGSSSHSMRSSNRYRESPAFGNRLPEETG